MKTQRSLSQTLSIDSYTNGKPIHIASDGVNEGSECKRIVQRLQHSTVCGRTTKREIWQACDVDSLQLSKSEHGTRASIAAGIVVSARYLILP